MLADEWEAVKQQFLPSETPLFQREKRQFHAGSPALRGNNSSVQRHDGGFTIKQVVLTNEPLVDALGREAIAQTRIVGRDLKLVIRSGLSNEELSITLYHEILEGVTVASVNPPEAVCDLNEAGFEAAARHAHRTWGQASVENVNRMLQFYGFREE